MCKADFFEILDGLDFLRDTDEKSSVDSRPKSTKKNAGATSSAADSNHIKQGGSSKKEGGWGAESNDMEIVDFRLQRTSTDAAKNFDAPDEDDDDDIPVIPTLGEQQ